VVVELLIILLQRRVLIHQLVIYMQQVVVMVQEVHQTQVNQEVQGVVLVDTQLCQQLHQEEMILL
tara:strand:- start:347 stop:541 length:195 start_codon:yes stop_codon:yes gene_type:complete